MILGTAEPGSCARVCIVTHKRSFRLALRPYFLPLSMLSSSCVPSVVLTLCTVYSPRNLRHHHTTQVGARYEPLFPYFAASHSGDAFKVVSDGYVTDDSGTGVVHQAPAFGEDDYRCVFAFAC